MNAVTHTGPMSTRAASMTVTTTGIRIGIATVPVQRIEPTQDAARLQSVLLAKQSKPRSPEFYITLLGMVLGLAVFVMSRAGWLPGGGA